jgi:7-cyano-7-deazaguanine synthase
MSDRAVVLLSGGLDSTTVAAIARSQGYEIHALSFDYKQRHRIELKSAKAVADHLRIASHRIIELPNVGGSALTDQAIEVPKTGLIDDIPVTYVPARNTIFLSFALAWAEVIKADTIFIGVNALDYSGYPDCRPEFIDAFEQMANLATKRAVEGQDMAILAPLLEMSKQQIVARALELGVPLEHTWSCYDPQLVGQAIEYAACGRCDSCLLRLAAFQANGVADPARYGVDLPSR